MVVGSRADGSQIVSLRVSGRRTLAAPALLPGLRCPVAWAFPRGARVGRLARSGTTLIARTVPLLGAMRRRRVSSDELPPGAGAQDHADPMAVAAIVVEGDGTLGALADSPPGLTGAAPRVDAASKGGHAG